MSDLIDELVRLRKARVDGVEWWFTGCCDNVFCFILELSRQTQVVTYGPKPIYNPLTGMPVNVRVETTSITERLELGWQDGATWRVDGDAVVIEGAKTLGREVSSQ